jgi:hypothetical protein
MLIALSGTFIIVHIKMIKLKYIYIFFFWRNSTWECQVTCLSLVCIFLKNVLLSYIYVYMFILSILLSQENKNIYVLELLQPQTLLWQDYVHKVPVILHDNLQRESHKSYGRPISVI